ncbi:MAG: hypothetical protein IT539_04255 [Bradyrhizobiaceae bacterium]|nr:hypothetical protein [Bradyrhizobiaceae bacterium]
MNWLALLGAILKLVTAIADTLRDWRLVATGEASGRAESDADHAREAAARGEEMRGIAARPPARTEVEKRLEEGSA